MSPNVYRILMTLVERAKHSGEKSPFKIVRAFRYYKYLCLSAFANWLILRVNINKLAENESQKNTIIASLTTFPARINQVRYAIKSILLQTVRPHKVLLWLSREQFPNEKVPESITDLCEYGLEIRFCDDLRSHKKYYYALQEQKADDIIITFDDDIIYHPHTIERLIKKHSECPECIVCSQVHLMTYDEKGSIKPYSQWSTYKTGIANPNKDFMPLTGSGCLYPYHVMPKATFQKDRLMKCAFTADDLWIGYLARISGVAICTTDKPAKIFSVVKSSQSQHLGQINCIEDGDDKTLKELMSVFGFKR